ncbi:MAG TPA: EamA family transporter [Candidatus Limnocylindrales bacterium]|nr:EamA family transporter [Candidatus Limnocylindrales bacterium]
MSSLALLLVLVAAALHVAWNVVIKTAGDPLRRSAVAMAASALVLAPLAIVGWLAIGRPSIPPEAFVLGTVSGVLEAIYFALLSAAYRRGDLSLVYPIARGTAPLLAVGAGVLVLGERLQPLGAAGVALLLVGLLALQRPWRFVRAGLATGEGPAVAFAALTGCSIAAYSAVDRVGARTTEPWIYGAILFAVGAVVLVAWTMWRRSGVSVDGGPTERPRRELALGALGGTLALGAYLLVLGAYTLAPLSAVAPLRESAIVVASAWGTLRMREARGADALGRLGAAALVVGGAILLALEASG